jgi:hypothetical protein
MGVLTMFLTGFFAIMYLLVAGFALLMTYDERQRMGMNGNTLKILSFLACLFWPATVLVALIMTQREMA